MTTPASTIHTSMQRQAARHRESSQASARPARVRISVQTVGAGESRLTGAKAIDFGALMLDEPTFSWGVVSNDSLAAGELPLCTATVLKWITNSNGAYTGAEVGLRVESAKNNVRLKFNLTFEATTIRSTAGNGTSASSVAATPNQYTGTTSAPSVSDL